MAGEGEGRREGGEGPDERKDFSEYVDDLKEKYGEARVEGAEKAEPKLEGPEDPPEVSVEGTSNPERERIETDDFRSYVEHLHRKYESESESEAKDATPEARVKTDRETGDSAESSTPGDVQKEITESPERAEPAKAPAIEENTKAEEAPTSEPKMEFKLDPLQSDPEPEVDRKAANVQPIVDAPLHGGSLGPGEAACPSPEEAAEKEREPTSIAPDLAGRRLDSVAVAHQSIEDIATIRVAEEEGRQDSSLTKLTEQGRDEAETHATTEAVTISALAYTYQIRGRDYDVRFDIGSDSFQQKTGFHFDEGKVYEIKGRIGDVCDFRKTHLEKDGNHVVILVPKEHRERVTGGGRFDIKIDSVEERRVFPVEVYDQRAVINLQRSMLQSLGLDLRDSTNRSKVVEFQVRDARDDSKTMRLFTQLEPHDSSARLSITKLGATKGDLFEVMGIGEYSKEKFVKEFNESGDTKRAKLLMIADKASLEVDGRQFPLSNVRFGTRALQVNLSAKMEPVKREMRFWYDGHRFTPKIGDCKILMFRSSRNELKIVHEASQNRITASRFHLPSEMHRQVLSEELDVGKIAKNVMALPRPLEKEGKYPFQIQPQLNDYARDWLYANNFGQLTQRTGTFSEELASNVLEGSGWKQMRKHPSASNGEEVGCNKPGFDRLMRWNASGELGLFEFRWYQDVDSAHVKARADVRHRLAKEAMPGGNGEVGAYIGILDWKVNERRGELHVERIWPRS